ncbi:MAG: hypothetical protein ABSH20_09565 [Tepidisphaeraceae bacterium]|jgi:uncharacterized membrane protein
MFSSLDRIDIVMTPTPDGHPRYVQTDHRTKEEIQKDETLSILFAGARVFNLMRLAEAGSPEPVVFYSMRERPPEFLERMVRASGGRVVLGANLESPTAETNLHSLVTMIGAALADLAAAVAAEHAVTLSANAIGAIERALAQEAGSPEKDETAYWSAVMKLGAFAGEAIRASNGGEWVLVKTGSLPFALSTRFGGEQATINPLGKAIKRFAVGEEESLATLAELIIGQP